VRLNLDTIGTEYAIIIHVMKPRKRRRTMKQWGYWFIIFSTFLLLLPAMLLSDSHYTVVNGPKDFYYGHISLSEVMGDGKDAVVLREGETVEETAVLNLPIGPGDTIRTSERRCEIQFDNGTIIRLDLNTELKIETILAQSLSSPKQITNFLLPRGRIYVMFTEYGRLELFQILTSNAAVKMNNHTVALIEKAEDGATDIQVQRGKADVLFGPEEKNPEEKKIAQLQRITIFKNNNFQVGSFEAGSDFEKWNESVNENFEKLHEGQSILPKPIQKLPPAVFYFAQKYGDLYGEWVWDNLYGYVWRPYIDRYYPGGNWQPYIYGQWCEVGGQMFWVPEEPWGWVPYHLGIWQWDKKLGWIWIPGSAFAPAWVDWAFFAGNYTWRPWSLWDWYYGSDYDAFNMAYFGNPYYYAGYFYSWPGYNAPHPQSSTNILYSIRKDQLKKKVAPTYPLPKEVKKVYDTFVTALKKGDPRVLESFQNIPKQIVLAKREDIISKRIQEKVLDLEKFTKQRGSLPAPNRFDSASLSQTYRVLRTLRQPKTDIQLRNLRSDSTLSLKELNKERMTLLTGWAALSKKGDLPFLSDKSLSVRPSPRFRDWNPDIKTALSMGVEINYSPRLNEIRCPQLGLNSHNVVPHREMGFHLGGGGFYSSGGSYSSGTPSYSSSHNQSSGTNSSGQEGGSHSSGGAKKN
jgi:hypothetical protein